jgi:hypothetical protein
VVDYSNVLLSRHGSLVELRVMYAPVLKKVMEAGRTHSGCVCWQSTDLPRNPIRTGMESKA